MDTLHIDKKHKMKIVDIDSDNDVIFITKDDKSKKIHKIVKIKASEEKDGLNWTTEDDHEDVKIISMDKSSNIEIISENGKEPLYILDGKEITPKEMKDILRLRIKINRYTIELNGRKNN